MENDFVCKLNMFSCEVQDVPLKKENADTILSKHITINKTN